MTRFEECFPPDIVRAVYARLKREEDAHQQIEESQSQPNVVSLAAYRLMREREQKVVS
ncbi:hypothetical protein G6L91_11470 [Agrobacterium rhizogenes]|uniref:hypothetical protein n=1 Tax=Rhizobium rhizogenes TaxID=359 RepID=UPI001572C7A7|nr:hypothetical protein [Rhizobium rhizogenes]NTF62086.1 hypothetical protein [Rhizobium rhizogenes]